MKHRKRGSTEVKKMQLLFHLVSLSKPGMFFFFVFASPRNPFPRKKNHHPFWSIRDSAKISHAKIFSENENCKLRKKKRRRRRFSFNIWLNEGAYCKTSIIQNERREGLGYKKKKLCAWFWTSFCLYPRFALSTDLHESKANSERF